MNSQDQFLGIEAYYGIVISKVSRFDLTVMEGNVTVDKLLNNPSLKRARPSVSVTGIIEIEHFDDVLYVEQPALLCRTAPLNCSKLLSVVIGP